MQEEEIIKTDEELNSEYYDWYCNIIHNQKMKLLELEEFLFQKWYDENELNIKKLKDNGYSERAIMKKAYVLGLSVGK